MVALEIASPLDLGPATGAAPSGQPTNNTTAPADALEIASSLDLGPAGAKARRSKLAQPNSLPLQGAPRPLAWQPVHRTGSSTICLLFQPKPLAVALLSTPSPRLRTTARLSPRVRVRPPASPDPPPSAHGLPRGSPAPDASTRAQPASASKPKTKTPQGTPPRQAGPGGPRGVRAGVARRSRSRSGRCGFRQRRGRVGLVRPLCIFAV